MYELLIFHDGAELEHGDGKMAAAVACIKNSILRNNSPCLLGQGSSVAKINRVSNEILLGLF